MQFGQRNNISKTSKEPAARARGADGRSRSRARTSRAGVSPSDGAKAQTEATDDFNDIDTGGEGPTPWVRPAAVPASLIIAVLVLVTIVNHMLSLRAS